MKGRYANNWREDINHSWGSDRPQRRRVATVDQDAELAHGLALLH